MRLSACYCWCVALALSCQFTWAANLDRVKSMADVITSEGLYSSSDKVAILNVTTFESTVSGTDVAWLIEFYNTWCGHCQRYAPIWKEFAADVAGWSGAVRIGVVDCVVEANTPLCRDYEIMEYPTVKFISAHHLKGDYGTKIDKGHDALEMRRILADTLEKEQLEGRGSSWPNITPYRSSDLHNLWKDIPDSVVYSILLFKDRKNEVGADLVLDFSRIPSIQMRTVSAENEALSKLMQVSNLPSVVVVERGKDVGEVLYTQDPSRIGLKTTIQAFLTSKNIELAPIEIGKDEVVKMPPANAEDDADLQKQVKHLMLEKGDVAFLADLEHALRFSLRHEVSSRKHMTGPVLKALQNYLHVIRRLFPLSENSRLLLNSLCSYADGVTELSGEEWKKQLAEDEAKLTEPAWTEQSKFLGCRGSRPNYRGYPCSLWTTFHVLTVSALESNSGQPRDVLEAILGYVTHFFGCAECSKHFQEMASETMFSDVTSHKDSVLWLWKAHNKVNNRLTGDPTEDPAFPKIQFPSVDRCPGCRDNGVWVMQQVLQYLQSVYSHGSLSVIGAAGSYSKANRDAQSISSGSEMSALDMSLLILLQGALVGCFSFLVR